MTVTQAIRRAVRDSGQSVNALARACDVPQPSLHRFLAGERDLKLATAEKLMRHLGLEAVRKKGKRK